MKDFLWYSIVKQTKKNQQKKAILESRLLLQRRRVKNCAIWQRKGSLQCFRSSKIKAKCMPSMAVIPGILWEWWGLMNGNHQGQMETQVLEIWICIEHQLRCIRVWLHAGSQRLVRKVFAWRRAVSLFLKHHYFLCPLSLRVLSTESNIFSHFRSWKKKLPTPSVWWQN